MNHLTRFAQPFFRFFQAMLTDAPR